MIPTYIQTIPTPSGSINDVPVGGFWPVQITESKLPNKVHISQVVPEGQRWSIRVRLATEPDNNTTADPVNYTQTGNEVHFDAPDMSIRPPTVARIFVAKRQR